MGFGRHRVQRDYDIALDSSKGLQVSYRNASFQREIVEFFAANKIRK